MTSTHNVIALTAARTACLAVQHKARHEEACLQILMCCVPTVFCVLQHCQCRHKHGFAGQDALCGSTLMIGIDELIEDGLLGKADKPKKVPVGAADFVAVCCFFPAVNCT